MSESHTRKFEQIKTIDSKINDLENTIKYAEQQLANLQQRNIHNDCYKSHYLIQAQRNIEIHIQEYRNKLYELTILRDSSLIFKSHVDLMQENIAQYITDLNIGTALKTTDHKNIFEKLEPLIKSSIQIPSIQLSQLTDTNLVNNQLELLEETSTQPLDISQLLDIDTLTYTENEVMGNMEHVHESYDLTI